MIYLTAEQRHIVENILRPYEYTFYAFGSRVSGKHRPLSDLDLCYKQEIPAETLAEIRAAFTESNLPFKVDLVDYQASSPSFRAIIDRTSEVFDVV
jgi:uncharacterized protein